MFILLHYRQTLTNYCFLPIDEDEIGDGVILDLDQVRIPLQLFHLAAIES